MKTPIQIFCEGVTDQVLIADCLEIFYALKVNREEKKLQKINMKGKPVNEIKINMTFDNGSKIIDIGGCDNLTQPIHLNNLRDNSELGGINLVIFDADELSKGNNSFSNATQKLNAIKRDHQVNFDFYLWPNHSDDGEVENLIRQLIHPSREPVMKCIEVHQNCLISTGFNNLRLADNKTLIKFYLYTNYIDKTETRYVDYKDSSLWNMSPADVQDLQKFKDFLDHYFLKSLGGL